MLPEGAAYDTTRDRFLRSSGRRRNVIAVDADGRCHELLAPGNDGLLAVLGMDVDAARDTLWVASAAAPFMHDAASAKPGETRLSRIDLASGRVVASYTPASTGLLNDLDLLPDGRVAVTASVAGTVHLLAPTDAVPSLQPLLAAGSFEGPNGIVARADGQLLDVYKRQHRWIPGGAPVRARARHPCLAPAGRPRTPAPAVAPSPRRHVAPSRAQAGRVGGGWSLRCSWRTIYTCMHICLYSLSLIHI